MNDINNINIDIKLDGEAPDCAAFCGKANGSGEGGDDKNGDVNIVDIDGNIDGDVNAVNNDVDVNIVNNGGDNFSDVNAVSGGGGKDGDIKTPVMTVTTASAALKAAPQRPDVPPDQIHIADEVITQIITIAVNRVAGVNLSTSGVGDGLAGFLGMKGASRGVRIDTDGRSLVADISISVDYGGKINEIAKTLQDEIRNDLTEMTGLEVTQVNVHITSINTKEQAAAKTSKASPSQAQQQMQAQPASPSRTQPAPSPQAQPQAQQQAQQQQTQAQQQPQPAPLSQAQPRDSQK